MNIGLAVIFGGLLLVALVGIAAKQTAPAAAATTPTTGSGTSSPTSPSSSTTAPSSLPSGGQTHGLVSMAALQAIGAQHGWSPQEIADWMNVIVSESNGTLTDTNPSSGAYGIAQFINGPGEYSQYGGNANTLEGQLTAMANYIAQRYGNPSAAWQFHLAHNWY